MTTTGYQSFQPSLSGIIWHVDGSAHLRNTPLGPLTDNWTYVLPIALSKGYCCTATYLLFSLWQSCFILNSGVHGDGAEVAWDALIKISSRNLSSMLTSDNAMQHPLVLVRCLVPWRTTVWELTVWMTDYPQYDWMKSYNLITSIIHK